MARSPIVGGVGFELTVDDSKFIQQLRKAGERGKRELEGTTTEADRLEDQLRQTGDTGERALRSIETGADRVNDQLLLARRNMDLLRNTVSGLALGAAFVQGAKTIADFEQSMSTLQAVSGAVGVELQGLREKALELGASTRFSATQAADAMGELARAGFTANEVLAAIGPTLSAAQAGGADIASTAEIIGSTIRGFGIEAGDAARVADVLAQAANASNAGILDLGEALKFAAPTARQLGLDLEETIAVIGKLSDGGLKGGLAGRGFQSLATQIVNNREEIQALIGDFNLAEEGLGGVLRRLKEAGITTEQIIKLFRAENLDTFGILANAAVDESLAGLEKVLRAAEGSSARAAAIMDNNLNGAILGAQSRLEALIIALGDAGATSALITALDGLSGLLKLAADNADVLQAAIIALAVRALLPMAFAIGGKVIASVVALQAQLVVLTAIAGRSVTTLAATAAVAGRLAFAFGPLTIGIAAAAAAYIALARDAQRAEERLARATSAIDKGRAALESTKDLVSASDSPFQQVGDQAEGAARTVADLTSGIDALAEGISNLRKESQLSKVFEIGDALTATDAAIAELRVERDKAARRASRREVKSGVLVNPRALEEFDQSEAGRKLLQLEQQRAFLEARARKAAEGLTFGDIADQFSGKGIQPTPEVEVQPVKVTTLGEAEQKALEDELAKIERIKRDITDAEAAGRADLLRIRKEELAVSEKIVAQLEAGRSVEFAEDFAKAPKVDKAAQKDAKATADEVKRLDGEWQKVFQTRLQQVETWKTAELDAISQLKISDDERARLRQQVFDLEQERIDEITIDELNASNAIIDAEAKKRRRIEDVIAGRDLELAILEAQAAGDEKGLKALEERRDKLQRINELLEAGLPITEAMARAEEEITRLKSGQFSEAAKARREFTEGLSSDISSALTNAIRSGDYGTILQEVINSAAARGLEDAITDLSESLATFFADITFGKDGTSGVIGDIAGSVGTPPILDTKTAEAAANSAGAAATTASITALGTAATAGATAATAAASADAAAAAAASALATVLGAVTLAAQAAAASLASVSAGQGVSQVSSLLDFGGGRARGGPVVPGKFYEVNEGGIAEMLRIGSKNFLLPGAAGQVTPLAGAKAPAPSERTVARHEIYVHGTGNEEIRRAVDEGVQRSVRIARGQAGPAAAEFQTRKV